MASFTDSIPTFNPYVSQQPIESMVKVGMMKQQKYDTNLQKIQQSMSEIAGLQIGRDIDKEYLEKKVSEVSSRLRVFASGDFSNNNLTTSMRGMIAGIADDKIIQNSVRSTMAAQNAKQLQSKANADGNGSPSNDYALDKQLSTWYNDEEVGAIFSGSYKPYTEYQKPAMEVIKNLAKDHTENEVAFDFDNKGNIIGIRDAISNTVIEGITVEKIQAALKAQLSPAMWEQMSMDGIYQYSGVSDEKFITSTRERHSSIIDNINEKISDLQALATMAEPRSKLFLEQQIKGLESYSKSVEIQFNSIDEQLESGNLDGAKAKIFAIDWMDNMGNSFASSSVKKTYRTNPFKTVQLTEAQMRQTANIAKAKFDQVDRHFDANFLQKERFHKDDLDADAAEAGLDGSGTRGRFGNMELPGDPNHLSNSEYIKEHGESIESDEVLVGESLTHLLNKWKITEEQKDTAVLIGESTTNVLSIDLTKDLNGLETKKALLAGRNKSTNQIKENADKLYPIEGERLLTVDENKTFYAEFKDSQDENNLVEFTTEEAVTAFKEFDKEYFTKNVVYTGNQGHITKSVDDERAYRDFTITESDTPEEAEVKATKRALYEVWREEQGVSRDFRDNIIFDDITGGGVEQSNLWDYVEEIGELLEPRVVNNKKIKDEYVANELKTTNLTFGPKAYSINLPKTADKDDFFSSVLAPLALTARTGGIPDSKLSSTQIISYIEHFASAFVSTDGSKHILHVTGTGAYEGIDIPLDDKIYKVFKDKYEPSPAMKIYYEKYIPKMLSNINPVEPAVHTFDEAQKTLIENYKNNSGYDPVGEDLNEINRTAGDAAGKPVIDEYGNQVYREVPKTHWTTATDGQYITTFENAGIKHAGNFRNVKYYGISGNVNSEASPVHTEYVYLKLNIFDPISGRKFPNVTLPEPVHVTQIDAVINRFTDEAIWQLLNKTPDKSIPQLVLDKLKDASSSLVKAARKLKQNEQ